MYFQFNLGWIKVKTKGVTGHASKYLGYGALDKLHKSCDRALEFRQQEADKFNAGTPIGDIVTLNITSLKMGKTMDNGSTYALNVIPSDAEAGFDIRIPPSMDLEKFETDLVTLLTNNDPDIEFERITGITKNVSTSIDPEKNKWWAKFKQVCLELGIDIVPQVFPAATDSRYLRILGIPCLGFSPLRNTPVKFHDHDEYLECSVYLASIPIYMEMIKNLVELIE